MLCDNLFSRQLAGKVLFHVVDNALLVGVELLPVIQPGAVLIVDCSHMHDLNLELLPAQMQELLNAVLEIGERLADYWNITVERLLDVYHQQNNRGILGLIGICGGLHGWLCVFSLLWWLTVRGIMYY